MALDSVEPVQKYTPLPSRGNRYKDKQFLDALLTKCAVNAYFVAEKVGCHVVTAQRRLRLLALYNHEVLRRYKDGIDSASKTFFLLKKEES